MNPPTLLIFDLDGTISDPAVGICRSINYALEAFGYQAIADESVSKFIGPPLDSTFRALTHSTDFDHIAELVAKYRERYGEVGYAENVLYPGVPEAIAHLASNGVTLGLCTSKRVDFAEKILTLFRLGGFFSVVSGGEVGIGKDHQLRTLLASGAVGPKSTMIGDRNVDVSAARANHLRAIGVLWGHGSEEELKAARPDLLLRQPEELANLTHAV